MADEEGFAARWSRRKRQVAAEAEAEATAPDAEALAAEDEARRSEEEANRLAAEAVDLDALGYGDDFSVFLRRGVPDLLRRKALRRFFNSDPLLANLDGLNDYDEDYNAPAQVVYKSSWNAARGYLTEADEIARDAGARREQAGEALDVVAPAAPDAPDAAAEEVEGPATGEAQAVPEADPKEASRCRPRRRSTRRRAGCPCAAGLRDEGVW